MKPILIYKKKANSKEDIEKVEKILDITFPDDYKNFLLNSGGGKIKANNNIFFYSKYDDINIYVENIFRLNELEKINKDYNLKKLKCLAIASYTSGHDMGDEMAFMYVNKKHFGKIFINNYYVDKKTSYKEENFILIADSFDEFINGFEETKIFPFEKFCSNSEFDKAIELLNNGLDANSTDFEGTKLILIASMQWHTSLELIKTLVEKGANVNELEYNDSTPLFGAVVMGDNPDVVRYLLENNADINHRDYDGMNALERLEKRIEMRQPTAYINEMYDILKEAYSKQNKK